MATTEELIAERRFTNEDQVRFAAFSGDRNPIHMDPLAARRSQAGEQVVHGVNGVLWLLDALCSAGEDLGWVRGLKVQFHRFVTLGQSVAVRVSRRAEGQLKAELFSGETVMSVVTLQAKPPRAGDLESPSSAGETRSEPADLSLAAMSGAAGVLALPDPAGAAELYPALAGAWGAPTVSAIAGLSTLVGMDCPGLHSLFAGFSVSIGAPAGGLGWRVARMDERFRMVWIDVSSGELAGEVTAFGRQPPVEPPTFEAASAAIPAHTFGSVRALVVGGSRGLGAAAATLLAAGGADVTVTFASGDREAAALVAAINAGRGEAAARAVRLDVRRPVAGQLGEDGPAPTHVLYFATSRIGGGKGVFDPAVHADLFEVHVNGLKRVLDWAEARAGGQPLAVFTPSTIFVESRPEGMTEYAMVKAALEVLCRDWMAARSTTSIETPRLPRILTDQTATTPPVPAEDVMSVLPAHLIRFAG